jgi:hypothetical protein
MASPVSDLKPFDPRTDVSADARFIVDRILLWFLVFPLVIGVIGFVLSLAFRQGPLIPR